MKKHATAPSVMYAHLELMTARQAVARAEEAFAIEAMKFAPCAVGDRIDNVREIKHYGKSAPGVVEKVTPCMPDFIDDKRATEKPFAPRDYFFNVTVRLFKANGELSKQVSLVRVGVRVTDG